MNTGFTVYWLIGCLTVGIGISQHLARCPNDVPQVKLEHLVLVAAWPVGLVIAASLPKGFVVSHSKCEAP